MKIYANPASHNCRRVLATAKHLGIDYELVEPNMQAGEHKSPEFLAINPNGKVPALVDGDLKVWESNAIMQYLGSQKTNSLFPADPAKRVEVTRWQFWEANHLSKGTGTLGFENVFKPFVLKQEPNAAEVEKGIKAFHEFAPVLNGQLEGNKFILGNELSLADFSVGADFTYAAPGKFPLENYPHIRKWLAQLDEIDAWKSTAPKLG